MQATSSAFYQTYQREQRLRLARVLAPIVGTMLAVVCGGATAYLLLHPQEPTVLLFGDGVLIASVFVWFGSGFAAWRGHAALASGGITLATSLGILVFGTSWAFTRGVDLFVMTGFTSCAFAIMLAGSLSERGMVILTTLLMNSFTLLILMAAPAPPGMVAILKEQRFLAGSQAIFQQWGFAFLLLALQRATQRNLQRLGESQQEIAMAHQLDSLKNQFISSVNHELRSPVMAMLVNLEHLTLTFDRAPHERVRPLVLRAFEASKHLRTLIENILDTRQLSQDTQPYTATVVSVSPTFARALTLLDPNEGKLHETPLVERSLYQSIPEDLTIWGDPIYLQRIFTNLLSNALKYSDPGTPIEVRAQEVTVPVPESTHPLLRRRHPGRNFRTMVEIRIRDHGYGIPPEQIPLLFNRFVRLPRDLASNTLGNGLGLFLVRSLTEKMGGDVWIESDGIAGEGSTFCVRLPVPPSESGTSSSIPSMSTISSISEKEEA